jgi:hypothetical protein
MGERQAGSIASKTRRTHATDRIELMPNKLLPGTIMVLLIHENTNGLCCCTSSLQIAATVRAIFFACHAADGPLETG